jgi:hypothetical protein
LSKRSWTCSRFRPIITRKGSRGLTLLSLHLPWAWEQLVWETEGWVCS